MNEKSAPKPPVPIYVNPRAGMGGNGEGALEREARALGLPVELREVEPARLTEALKSAVELSLPVVGVAGGDGSLRTAANVLAGTQTALAPVPAGTLNRFCRRLGIFSPNQALYRLSQGSLDRVAVGVVDDELFLNTAIFGFYSEVVRKRERLRPWITKWIAAAASTALFMAKAPLLDIWIEVEGVGGARLHRTTPMLWIGLGGGSFPFVHKAPRPQGPNLLEVAIVGPTTRRGMALLGMRILAQVARRRHPIRLSQIEVFHASQVLLDAPGRIGVTLDGEPSRMDAPVLARAQEGALSVVAPADSAPAPRAPAPGDAEGLAVPFEPSSDA